jgi:hypothetical protein
MSSAADVEQSGSPLSGKANGGSRSGSPWFSFRRHATVRQGNVLFIVRLDVVAPADVTSISPVQVMAHRKNITRITISKTKPTPPPIYILDSFWLPALSEE